MTGKPKYISILSTKAMKAKEFCIILANVDNTPEKLELAKKQFPEPDFIIHFHFTKYDMTWVTK